MTSLALGVGTVAAVFVLLGIALFGWAISTRRVLGAWADAFAGVTLLLVLVFYVLSGYVAPGVAP